MNHFENETKKDQPTLPENLKDRLAGFVNKTYGGDDAKELWDKYSTAIGGDDILGLLELSGKVENSVAYWGEKLDRKDRDALYALDADLKKWLDESTK